MVIKWSLKRVNRFFYSLRELHAPADFFIRQYRDINVDRMKQVRLLGAFGPDSSLHLMPCFGCRRFYKQRDIDERLNGSVFFYEGRPLARCYGCMGGRPF
jgi:hypothetical protein